MKSCSQCGTPITNDSPEGLCARCMISVAMQAQTLDSQRPGGVPHAPGASAIPSDAVTIDGAGEGEYATIGNYKLLQRIGEGGFGTVFMAEQERPVRRRVAIKIIKLGMDTKQVIARFEAERQALAMMDHPHIAKVFDAGATDTGRPYFVMELVRGVPITEYCDTQNLSTRERLELFIPVCNAVQHAHQKGIIHRDIKPSNVLVTLADGKPIPKIIDFGIAKATNARLTEQTYFTEFRQLIGTPEYMSPEQAEMTGIDIDTRSDIYSLGVVLYQLLTGTTPFDARELRRLAYEQMQRTIREVEPPRPSTRLSGLGDTATAIAHRRKTEPRKLAQMMRGELDWIVMRAMEKDRTRRYDTPGSLAADIQRHLGNEPVLARPPSTVYAVRKFFSRHRFGVAASAAMLMALLVGFALATIGFIRAKSAGDIAEKARIEAQLQKRIAEDQKQLAVDSARSANENARKAEVRLAEGLLSQADTLSLANRFAEAHPIYAAAYDKLVELKEPLTSAVIGLWNSYHHVTAVPLLNLNGHTAAINSIAISPSGRTALSGSADHTLKLWDLATGKELQTLTGHTGRVNCVVISPDGRTALSSSGRLLPRYPFGNDEDETLRLWDLATGKEIRRITGSCAAFAPDSKTAISGNGTELLLWDLATGKALRTWMTRSFGDVTSVAISPDGKSVLSGHLDGTLRMWNLPTPEALAADKPDAAAVPGEIPAATFSGHTNYVITIAISLDSRNALSGSEDGTVKLWDMASQKELRTLSTALAPVRCVAFAPDGKTAISASSDKTLTYWDLASGMPLHTFIGHADSVNGVAITPDGLTAVSGSADKTLKVWSLAGGNGLRTFKGHQADVLFVAMAPDGRTAISGGGEEVMKLWDLASGKELRTFFQAKDDPSSPEAVVFAPDGRTALSAKANRLELLDLTSGKVVRMFDGSNGDRGTNDIAIAPDGRTALSLDSMSTTLTRWDLAGGTELLNFGEPGEWSCVAISPDSRAALWATPSGPLTLWNLASGELLRTFTGHADGATSIAFTADGRTALTGSHDWTLKLWDLSKPTALRTFSGHSNTVLYVAIFPDGRTALSASTDNTLKLWDLAGGKELRTLSRPNGLLSAAALAPDGRSVFSGGNDGTVTFWDFARGAAERDLEPRVIAAQARLQLAPNDPAALATLGEWYAFHGLDQRAIELLARARENGAAVAPLTLARCYWNLQRLADARREFQIAMEQSKDTAERTYLGWCVASIERELERKRQ